MGSPIRALARLKRDLTSSEVRTESEPVRTTLQHRLLSTPLLSPQQALPSTALFLQEPTASTDLSHCLLQFHSAVFPQEATVDTDLSPYRIASPGSEVQYRSVSPLRCFRSKPQSAHTYLTPERVPQGHLTYTDISPTRTSHPHGHLTYTDIPPCRTGFARSTFGTASYPAGARTQRSSIAEMQTVYFANQDQFEPSTSTLKQSFHEIDGSPAYSALLPKNAINLERSTLFLQTELANAQRKIWSVQEDKMREVDAVQSRLEVLQMKYQEKEDEVVRLRQVLDLQTLQNTQAEEICHSVCMALLQLRSILMMAPMQIVPEVMDIHL